MRPFVFIVLGLMSAAGLAATAPAEKAGPSKTGRATIGGQFPPAVEGVTPESFAQVRRALLATFGEQAMRDARQRLTDLKERAAFTKGRNESEDLRLDFEQARDSLVAATLEATRRFDPTLSKDDTVRVLNAVEEANRKRGQEANRAAQEKRAAAELAAKESASATQSPAKPAAKEPEAGPVGPAELLAEVDGVTPEDMRRFRIAAVKAQADPAVQELKARLNQLRKEAEFLSPDERRGRRGDFETLLADQRKANLAAIVAAAPTLPRETLVRIYDAVESRARESAEKSARKAAAKPPLKPFPFGEKK